MEYLEESYVFISQFYALVHMFLIFKFTLATTPSYLEKKSKHSYELKWYLCCYWRGSDIIGKEGYAL